jgi:hypothetical protein
MIVVVSISCMSNILTNIFLEVECGGPSWRCYKISKFCNHFGHNLLGQSSFIGFIHFDVVECLNSKSKKMSKQNTFVQLYTSPHVPFDKTNS